VLRMGGKKGARAAALKRDLLKAAYAGDIAAVNRCLAPDYSNINFAREDGATALHMACSSGSVECVHHLLRAGADHKKKDSRGLTPLYDACLTKSDTHIKCVEILLHAGASARIATKAGYTTVHAAADIDSKELTQLLLQHGVTADACNQDGVTALHTACLKGNAPLVEVLLDHGGGVNVADKEGYTPLMAAVLVGCVEAIKLLLKHGANVNAYQKDGATPLYMASCVGHADCVKLLLDAGAPSWPKNDGDLVPLIAAAQQGQTECVRLLIGHGADVNAVFEGQTALFLASFFGHAAAVQLLLDAGAAAETPCLGNLPLESAAAQDFLDCVDLLLAHGVNPDTCSPASGGCTPLFLACQHGRLKCVQALLAHNADPAIAKTGTGSTPMLIASQNNHCACVNALLEIKSGLETVNITDKLGATPLTKTCFQGNEACVEALLSHGSDPSPVSSEGFTPLMLAALSMDVAALACARLLLQYGAEVNSCSDDGQTALAMAARMGSVPLVELLLTYGAEVNLADKDGHTPLTRAAGRGHVAVVKLLCDWGAEPYIINKDGQRMSIAAGCPGAAIRRRINKIMDAAAARTPEERQAEKQRLQGLLVRPHLIPKAVPHENSKDSKAYQRLPSEQKEALLREWRESVAQEVGMIPITGTIIFTSRRASLPAAHDQPSSSAPEPPPVGTPIEKQPASQQSLDGPPPPPSGATDQPAVSSPAKACFHCGALSSSETGTKLKLCSGCRSVWFCGAECQATSWPQHRAACKAMKRPARSSKQ